MAELWGQWGVSSEVDPLRAVLMRRPGKEIDDFDWQAETASKGLFLPRGSEHSTMHLLRFTGNTA